MQTALHSVEAEAGAHFREHDGWEISENFGDWEKEYWALKQAAGVVDLSFRGKLAAAGSERVVFLHRMLTTDVQSLQPGQGNYCFLLNAQGHILADMNLLMQPDRVLLDCEPASTVKLKQTLERFVIAADVEFEDVSARLGVIGVEGPLSREVICPALGFDLPHMKPLAHFSPDGNADFVVLRNALTEEGFWLIAPQQRLPQLWRKLAEAAGARGGRPVGFVALEAARIEAGTPRYGPDIEERSIPQETGQFRALSFNKGCYPGQEIVERVRSRGHVNRKLVGLIARDDKALRSGMKLTAGDREIGRVTSAAFSPGAGKFIALAYSRREFSEPGTQVNAEGVPAEVAPLPFPRR